MTDKKIIIDGVDVSLCRHFNDTDDGFNEDGELEEGACYNNPMSNEYGEIIAYTTCRGTNCIFKQRYKQEKNKRQLDRMVTKLDNILSSLRADIIKDLNEYNGAYVQDVYVITEKELKGLFTVLNKLKKIKDSL